MHLPVCASKWMSCDSYLPTYCIVHKNCTTYSTYPPTYLCTIHPCTHLSTKPSYLNLPTHLLIYHLPTNQTYLPTHHDLPTTPPRLHVPFPRSYLPIYCVHIFANMYLIFAYLTRSHGNATKAVPLISQIPNASGVFLGVCQLFLFCIYPKTGYDPLRATRSY